MGVGLTGWIPAYAGMTWEGSGMTGTTHVGMTGTAHTGMTGVGLRSTLSMSFRRVSSFLHPTLSFPVYVIPA